MTLQRRIVRDTIKIQTTTTAVIAAGDIRLVRAVRDYPNDPATRAELFIETEVVLPPEHPRPGELTVPGPAGLVDVRFYQTDARLPEDAAWVATIDDGNQAWHLFRMGDPSWCPEKAGLCGAVPEHWDGSRLPAEERQFWRATCTEEAGHDPSNFNTPHRATGLGRHGQGELTWPEPRTPGPEEPWQGLGT